MMEKKNKKEEVKEEQKEVQQQEKQCCCKDGVCKMEAHQDAEEKIDDNTFEESEEVLILKDNIANLEEKLKASHAELINYRKRKDEEVENRLKFANQDLILEILPILDNFERAIKLQKADDSIKKFLDGFMMIYNSLKETLKKYGVEEIDCLDKEFDHNFHQAMLVDKDETKPNNIVLEVLIKGYTLKGRIIRPASVKVNKLD